MDTRREFLKKAMLVSGAAGFNGMFPESIRKALAIDPAPGSTYLDAEHIVILMQENRSFDHCFGTLQGVRGFNDPRSIQLPNANRVWLQTNEKDETYAPFRFDIRDTKITWMGSIPHSRSSQVKANNGGKYDQWLIAKRSGNPKYAHMPLTMGYYTREDLPFNYALADAFTICDQHFSSAMTSTWPNRLFLWSGTIRGEHTGDAKAFIRNDIPWGEAHWTTFPELLEENGVSWKVYQNDITAGGGFSGEERSWLSNFGCNLLENFSQFNVRFSARYVQSLTTQVQTLPGEIEKLKAGLATAADKQKVQTEIDKKSEVLQQAKEGLEKWTRENFERLSEKEKNLYRKAFSNNAADPDYHQLENMQYEENGVKRDLNIPKGDILHQFREDVNNGKLPAVSWMVGPENFSDHPTAPWFGAWYVSEIMDILTKNPEVWKKTVFILTYDENDGYFDHIPPFVAPDPNNPESGKCSDGIRTDVEYIYREQELKNGVGKKEATEGPVGLGYRVPMIIASPWTRGGWVNSQVLDHTSVFRFIQDYLNKRSGKQIAETNVSQWRKTVSGELTGAFRPYNGEEPQQLPWLQKVPFMENIFNARFRKEPANFKALTAAEVAQINKEPYASPHMAQQEKGSRPSLALPYQLYAESILSDDNKSVMVTMEAGREVFGDRSAGSPFNIHLPGKNNRSYAVIAGDKVSDSLALGSFEQGRYDVHVQGPNGFYRQFRGDAHDPLLSLRCEYERQALNSGKLSGRVELVIKNLDKSRPYKLIITDPVYNKKTYRNTIKAGSELKVPVETQKFSGWYEIAVAVDGFPHYEKHYAGRVETGKDSISDPYMGRSL